MTRRGARGITLVETLASVVLGGMLLAALGSLASGLAKSAREIDRLHRWEVSAEAMMRVMHDEIACGRWPDVSDPATGPRVRAESDAIEIQVRASDGAGTERIGYAFRSDAGASAGGFIERSIRSESADSSVAVVLGEVAEMKCVIRGKVLEVRVMSVFGAERSRMIRLTSGDAT